MWAAELDENLDVQEVPSYQHETVLVEQTLAVLEPQPGRTYVDATIGGGGHTEALLRVPDTRVIGIDRDPAALRASADRLASFGDRLRLVRGEFGDLDSILADLRVASVDGVIADLGLSSAQLADGTRGMSFRIEGPLDMRMDPALPGTAQCLIEELDQGELADLIYKFGEERRSRRVARCIKLAIADGRLQTTVDLRRAVVRAVGPARVGGVDPATRTFQALRIAVNGELEQLAALLRIVPELLVPGGVVAILSFHSLEDRMVKRAFRDRDTWTALTKKPVTASPTELHMNPRSRSAKLRAARRPMLSADGKEVPS